MPQMLKIIHDHQFFHSSHFSGHIFLCISNTCLIVQPRFVLPKIQVLSALDTYSI